MIKKKKKKDAYNVVVPRLRSKSLKNSFGGIPFY